MTPTEGNDREAGVVIAAGGSGRRFGARKQYLELLGRPLLHWSLSAVSSVEAISRIVVVVPGSDLDYGRALAESWRETGRETVDLSVVAGGARRQDSVLRGLEALGPEIEHALVHDAARPLVRADDIRRLLDEVRRVGAAAIGQPLHDSVKRAEGRRIVEEVARDHLWAVQTPQGGRVSLLIEAYRQAADTECTDEATALRLAGVEVGLVEGARDNLKVTRPGDELLAEAILRAR